jgi:hypothetical protein
MVQAVRGAEVAIKILSSYMTPDLESFIYMSNGITQIDIYRKKPHWTGELPNRRLVERDDLVREYGAFRAIVNRKTSRQNILVLGIRDGFIIDALLGDMFGAPLTGIQLTIVDDSVWKVRTISRQLNRFPGMNVRLERRNRLFFKAFVGLGYKTVSKPHDIWILTGVWGTPPLPLKKNQSVPESAVVHPPHSTKMGHHRGRPRTGREGGHLVVRFDVQRPPSQRASAAAGGGPVRVPRTQKQIRRVAPTDATAQTSTAG